MIELSFSWSKTCKKHISKPRWSEMHKEKTRRMQKIMVVSFFFRWLVWFGGWIRVTLSFFRPLWCIQIRVLSILVEVHGKTTVEPSLPKGRRVSQKEDESFPFFSRNLRYYSCFFFWGGRLMLQMQHKMDAKEQQPLIGFFQPSFAVFKQPWRGRKRQMKMMWFESWFWGRRMLWHFGDEKRWYRMEMVVVI